MTDPAVPQGHPAPGLPSPPFQLNGKVAAVTGGASGIGESVARLLARQGAHVCLLDLDADRAGRVVAEIQASGHRASFTKCDVASGTTACARPSRCCGAPGAAPSSTCPRSRRWSVSKIASLIQPARAR